MSILKLSLNCFTCVLVLHVWSMLSECVYLDHTAGGALCSENENSVSRNRFLFCSPDMTSASSLRTTSLPPEHFGAKEPTFGIDYTGGCRAG